MEKKRFFEVYLIVFLGLFAVSSAAQEEPKQDLFDLSLEELMNVSVASNIIRSDEQQPASITTISQRQLHLSGARTLIEAIMTYVPGFFMVEDQDDAIAGFRGLAPDNNSKVLFLINGQNMNTEWFWGPPAALLNSNQMGYIEKIEVIRGPGSVTLGQGALLGVINIVTKNGRSLRFEEYGGHVSAGIGADDYRSLAIDLMQNDGKVNSFFHFGKIDYEGQSLRNEGWASAKDNEGYLGGKVFDIGTRLKRMNTSLLYGNVSFKNVNTQFMYASNEHDLYNFYRDRNVMGQELISIGTTYDLALNANVSFKIMADMAIDNYWLKSVNGFDMGGSRENRGGLKFVSNFNDLIPNNRLAVGFESRYFEFGRENFDGNNFLLNNFDPIFIEEFGNRERLHRANINNVMGYRDEYMIFSAFVEDFYAINNQVDVFGALRFDMHPFWGNNISPRLGALLKATPEVNMRFSYQSGFRGAVGLHYGGGYREDGFLRADNYDLIRDANIPIDSSDPKRGFHEDLETVKPEMMHSFELAFDYNPANSFSLNTVGFFNQIENVIDVGVIWADSEVFSMPDVGSDVPGNWNGYWFFKNTEGAIQQLGGEFSLRYARHPFNIIFSHALVKLLNADNQQKGSMYITNENKFKAYPENISRINVMYDISNSFAVSANYLYYYKWYSPRDIQAGSNHILNLSGRFDINEHFQAGLTIRNVLGQRKLYPMNSNADDTALSDGSPALEKTSYWVNLSYRF